MGNAEQWIQDFYQENCGCSLEDICGQHFWKKVLRGCIYREGLDELFETSPFWGLLFCGEAGTGKSTLGKAFLGELEGNGYKLIYLRADEILKDKAEAIPRAGQFQKECIKWEKTAIFLDNAGILGEDIPVAEQLAEGIDSLRRYNLPVIWMTEAEKAEDLPECLREQLYLCRIEVPDQKERLEYFQAMMGRLTDKSGSFNCSHMAELTEGYNFEQLNRITAFSKAFLKQKILEKCEFNWEEVRQMSEEGKICIKREQFCEIAGKICRETKEAQEELSQDLLKQMISNTGALYLQQERPVPYIVSGEKTTADGVMDRESITPEKQIEPQSTADISVSLDDELDMLDPSNLEI